jgi:hypothetical protein
MSTGSTGATGSMSTGSTGATGSMSTGSTGATGAASTGATGAASTGATGSTSTGATGSASTGATRSTSTGSTGISGASGMATGLTGPAEVDADFNLIKDETKKSAAEIMLGNAATALALQAEGTTGLSGASGISGASGSTGSASTGNDGTAQVDEHKSYLKKVLGDMVAKEHETLQNDMLNALKPEEPKADEDDVPPAMTAMTGSSNTGGTGSTGASGSTGSTGITGARGATGSGTAMSGASGATGSGTAMSGATGATAISGATGSETGSASTGPSEEEANQFNALRDLLIKSNKLKKEKAKLDASKELRNTINTVKLVDGETTAAEKPPSTKPVWMDGDDTTGAANPELLSDTPEFSYHKANHKAAFGVLLYEIPAKATTIEFPHASELGFKTGQKVQIGSNGNLERRTITVRKLNGEDEIVFDQPLDSAHSIGEEIVATHEVTGRMDRHFKHAINKALASIKVLPDPSAHVLSKEWLNMPPFTLSQEDIVDKHVEELRRTAMRDMHKKTQSFLHLLNASMEAQQIIDDGATGGAEDVSGSAMITSSSTGSMYNRLTPEGKKKMVKASIDAVEKKMMHASEQVTKGASLLKSQTFTSGVNLPSFLLNRKMKADKTLINFLEENVAKKDVSKDAKDAIRANFRSAYALYVAMPPQKEETDERRDEDILQHITAKGFDDVAIASMLRVGDKDGMIRARAELVSLLKTVDKNSKEINKRVVDAKMKFHGCGAKQVVLRESLNARKLALKTNDIEIRNVNNEILRVKQDIKAVKVASASISQHKSFLKSKHKKAQRTRLSELAKSIGAIDKSLNWLSAEQDQEIISPKAKAALAFLELYAGKHKMKEVKNIVKSVQNGGVAKPTVLSLLSNFRDSLEKEREEILSQKFSNTYRNTLQATEKALGKIACNNIATCTKMTSLNSQLTSLKVEHHALKLATDVKDKLYKNAVRKCTLLAFVVTRGKIRLAKLSEQKKSFQHAQSLILPESWEPGHKSYVSNGAAKHAMEKNSS